MNDNDVIILQTLVELREQLVGDYTGDYSDMKTLVDQILTKLLNKQLKK